MNPSESASIIKGYQNIRKVTVLDDHALYTAIDEQRNRPVTLQVLHKDISDDRALRLACAEELRLLTRLIHPNIVAVTDYGLWRKNPYVVSQAVTGLPLSQVVQQEALSLAEHYHIAVDVMRGVQHAHRNEVVHGRISPNNIIVEESGRATLRHFALRALQVERSDRVVRAASVSDSAFTPPERKIDSRVMTKAGDIFGVGVLCFWLFTKKYPEVKMHDADMAAAGVPEALQDVISLMISPDAHMRPVALEPIIQLFLRMAASIHPGHEPMEHELIQSVLPADEFIYLDTLHELVDEKVYVYLRRSDQKLFVAKRRPYSAGGFAEAVKLKSVSHPNIEPVLGAARHQSAQLVVSAYRAGGDLLGRMAHPWPVEICLDFLEKMLSALELVHGLGVLHRQLRPWHVVFDDSGQPAIADFGLHEEDLAPELSHGYAIPGETPSAQTDLFALGAMVYELMMGNRAYFVGEKLDAVPRFQALPASVRRVIEGLLVISPDERTESASEALYNLQVARGKIQPAPMASDVSAPRVDDAETDQALPAEERAERSSGKRVGWLLGGMLGLLAVSGLVWAGLSYWQTGALWPLWGLQNLKNLIPF